MPGDPTAGGVLGFFAFCHPVPRPAIIPPISAYAVCAAHNARSAGGGGVFSPGARGRKYRRQPWSSIFSSGLRRNPFGVVSNSPAGGVPDNSENWEDIYEADRHLASEQLRDFEQANLDPLEEELRFLKWLGDESDQSADDDLSELNCHGDSESSDDEEFERWLVKHGLEVKEWEADVDLEEGDEGEPGEQEFDSMSGRPLVSPDVLIPESKSISMEARSDVRLGGPVAWQREENEEDDDESETELALQEIAEAEELDSTRIAYGEEVDDDDVTEEKLDEWGREALSRGGAAVVDASHDLPPLKPQKKQDSIDPDQLGIPPQWKCLVDSRSGQWAGFEWHQPVEEPWNYSPISFEVQISPEAMTSEFTAYNIGNTEESMLTRDVFEGGSFTWGTLSPSDPQSLAEDSWVANFCLVDPQTRAEVHVFVEKTNSLDLRVRRIVIAGQTKAAISPVITGPRLRDILGTWCGQATSLERHFPPIQTRSMSSLYSALEQDAIRIDRISWTGENLHRMDDPNKVDRSNSEPRRSGGERAARRLDQDRLNQCSIEEIRQLGGIFERRSAARVVSPAPLDMQFPSLGYTTPDRRMYSLPGNLLISHPISLSTPHRFSIEVSWIPNPTFPIRLRLSREYSPDGEYLASLLIHERRQDP